MRRARAVHRGDAGSILLAGPGAPGPPSAPDPADPLPDPPDGLNLAFDVGEHGSIAVSPQPFADEGPEHHLEAHRTLESARRLAGKDPSPIQDRLRNHKQHSGLVLEHRTSMGYILYDCYSTYTMIYTE